MGQMGQIDWLHQDRGVKLSGHNGTEGAEWTGYSGMEGVNAEC